MDIMMRPKIGWLERVLDESGVGCPIYACALKPDGSEILYAADNRIIIIDPTDGNVMQNIKASGHKDTIYTLDWSHDGELFASGGVDKNVVIWNANQHEGLLKYAHAESVQCLKFSPVSQILLSCGMHDFALWTAAEKNVQKQRVSGKITCCGWNSDGQTFAIGTFDGCVFLRKLANFSEDPSAKIERPGGQPVWALAFNLPKQGLNESGDTPEEWLIVTDCSRTLSFYSMEGEHIPRLEKYLDFEPTCICCANNHNFLIVGGSNKMVNLYTREGILLARFADLQTWIWCVCVKPNTNLVYIGCVDGTYCHYILTFGTVHGLHDDRYAFRDHMTDVYVQHLSLETGARIQCRDCVRQIAIYGDKLAIRLTEELILFKQITSYESGKLEYKIIERLKNDIDCNLLVVTSLNIIFCTDELLKCHDQQGLKQREWKIGAPIRYIKCFGGPPGRETLLVGTKNGEVLKIFVDNPFPIKLVQISNPVRCIDLSVNRSKLAIVDENFVATVYDNRTLDILYQENNVNSLTFNAENDELVCFSHQTNFTIRANNFPGFHQNMNGFVVGFFQNRVFCLMAYNMAVHEVPFSNQMYQYIEQKLYEGAYQIAILGVTEEDWRILADDALVNMDLEVAAKAYARIKEYRMLQLIGQIKEMKEIQEPAFMIKALIMCYQGRFREAAALYRQEGYENKAVELFSDLKMFEDVQDVMAKASGETQKMLLRKRADWAKDTNQPKVAAEMLISSGDLDKATQLIVDNDWLDLAINVMRKLDRSDIDTLRMLAAYFVRKQEFNMAQKIFSMLGDNRAILKMHVSAGHWTDAFALADRFPKYVEDVYLPYARWLAEQDRFEEAQKAYHKAGREKEALNVLEQLTQNAVNENRFLDASYYHWLLGQQYLERSAEHPDLLPKYEKAAQQAEHFYAYEAVFMYCYMPFTSHPLETVLNMARFLTSVQESTKISMVLIYYVIAKVGRELGAFKFAREALDKLSLLKVPGHMQRQVDIMTLTIRAKPFSDSEYLLPVCYRCGLNNSMSNVLSCTHCKSPFVYSMSTFDNLPLLEFFVDEAIPPEEARTLIQSEPPLDDQDFNPFRQADKKKKWAPLVLGKDDLNRLEKTQVLILTAPAPLKTRYYYNAMPTIALISCEACCKFFQQDDYEMACLQKGFCPFCRTTQTRADPSIILDD